MILTILKALFLRGWYFGMGLLVATYCNPLQAADYWSCSGFFINSDGYIATADHCVKNGKKFYVYYKGLVYSGRVIGRDYMRDVAIIKTDIKNTSYLRLRTSVSRDSKLAVIGYPLGQIIPKMTAGTGSQSYYPVLNALHLYINTCEGNSGGPILNQKGEAVGVLTEGVWDFYHQGHCSRQSYGPSIQYIISLAQKYNIPYYQNDLLSPRSFASIYKETTEENIVVQFDGSSE